MVEPETGALPRVESETAPYTGTTASKHPGETPRLGDAIARSRQRARRASDRFRSEERRELRYLLSIAMAVMCSWTTMLLPPPVRRWVADRLGDAFFRLSKTYRENVIANVEHVLPVGTSELVIRGAARHIFRESARNFADLLLTPRRSRESIIRSLTLVEGDWSYIERPLAEGRGVVLFTAHLGAFDYIGQAMSIRGYNLTSVTGRTAARFIFDAVTYLRRSHGAGIVQATPSGIRKVMHALRRGECAAFVTDYDFFQNGRPVTFFGKTTTLPPGAVRIARDTGATIVGVFARRTDHGYEMTLTRPLIIDKTDDIDADLDHGLAKIVDLLEQAIGATPDQWVMFQRVWPLGPIDPVRVFPVGSPLESELLERVGAVLPGPRSPQKPG